MLEFTITNKQRILEIIAVLLTALGKFIFMDYYNQRFVFVATAVVLWGIYIYHRSRTNKTILNYWGFRTDNFNKVLRQVLPFGLFSIMSFIIIGYYQNTINFTWHIIPILITYPIWGTVQQFLMISLVAGNLKDLRNVKMNSIHIVFLTAILFSLVHYPIPWLMLGTLVLALFYGYIYLKNRNIYVLGIFHGWLGGLFYYTVLDTDPFLQTFGKLVL